MKQHPVTAPVRHTAVALALALASVTAGLQPLQAQPAGGAGVAGMGGVSGGGSTVMAPALGLGGVTAGSTGVGSTTAGSTGLGGAAAGGSGMGGMPAGGAVPGAAPPPAAAALPGTAAPTAPGRGSAATAAGMAAGMPAPGANAALPNAAARAAAGAAAPGGAGLSGLPGLSGAAGRAGPAAAPVPATAGGPAALPGQAVQAGSASATGATTATAATNPAGQANPAGPASPSGQPGSAANPAGPNPAAAAQNGVSAEASAPQQTQGDAAQRQADEAASRAQTVREAATEQTEFQRFVAQATGRSLPLFGYELFARGNFTASQGAAVPASYVLGPGDEVVVQVYGAVDLTERLTIDREGRVLIPQAGPLTLSGVRLGEAEKVLTAHLRRIYRNFNLVVTMGRVRSAEVFVVGQARNPGKHVVSGLSTLINALFETGGPSANGSLRAVQLRRAGRTVATVDLYRFLAQGDSGGDDKLQPGDVIFIPPAGPRAAVLGTINAPAVYELLPGETIAQVLALSGGLPVLAAPQKAQLERVNPARAVARYVEDFALDAAGLARPLQAGDVLTVFQISPQIADVVTLQGNVAAPMRYTHRRGMRVRDLVADNNFLVPVTYWLSVNAGSNITGLDRPEVNLDYATIQRLDADSLRTTLIPFNLAKALRGDPAENLSLLPGDIVRIYGPGEAGPAALDSVAVSAPFLGGLRRFAWRADTRVSDVIPSADWLRTEVARWVRSTGAGPEKLDADQINLDYAVVRRVSADALRTEFIAFNLGKALRGDAAENLRLQPGDQITVYGPRVSETEAVNSVALSAPYLEGARRFAWRPGFKLSDVIPSAEWLRNEVTRWARRTGVGPEKLDADQMNLDYATVRRVNPATMRTEFVAVDLARGLRGDAKQDLVLLPGDQITLYAPDATPPEAVNSVTLDAAFLGGTRRHAWQDGYRIKDLVPSLPWLRDEVTRWVRRTGGAPATGPLTDHVNVEYAIVKRVDALSSRTETIAFHLARALQGDAQHNLLLQPGDQISLYAARQPGAEAQNSVTLNAPLLGGAQRHAWRPGHTVRDVIPSAEWLREQVARTVRATGGALAGGAYASDEINLDYATIRRLDAQNLRSELIAFNLGRALQGDPLDNLTLQPGDQIAVYGPREPLPETLNSISLRGEAIGTERRFVWRPGFAIRDLIPSADWLVTRYNYWQRESGKELRNDLNWDYAQVFRRVPDTLQTKALNFNLGAAVLQGRAEDNLPLQPGDRIALYTTQQMPVPVAKRVRMVTLAGEVRVPGVYQAAPGETLGQLVQRAGGFTPQAYTFGTDFRRESTRTAQQQNLDRLVQRLELQAQSDAQTRLQNVSTPEQQAVAQAGLQADRMRLAALKSLRATGRIALRLDADKPVQLPDITLEDGDTVTVPERPSFVAAFGAVNNDNVVLWKPGMTVGELLAHAGPTALAELEETHVLRADGTVLSAEQAGGGFFSRPTDIRHTRLMPGDTVVVPEKADRETPYTRFIRGAKDFTTIFYQFGLGAAAIKTLRN